jgi:ATP/maltotriose-dependent transcriptional regulator MalT
VDTDPDADRALDRELWQQAPLQREVVLLAAALPGDDGERLVEAGVEDNPSPPQVELPRRSGQRDGPDRVVLLYDERAGRISVLTKREREVLAAAATGASNAQIAAQLVIALGTVKKHLDNIYDKLEAANRTEAGVRMRELDPGHPLDLS